MSVREQAAKKALTKAEFEIVRRSLPKEIRHLSEAQLRSQIVRSKKYLSKHRDGLKRVTAKGKKSPIGVGVKSRSLRSKIAFFEKSQTRFEHRLNQLQARAERVDHRGVKNTRHNDNASMRKYSRATRGARKKEALLVGGTKRIQGYAKARTFRAQGVRDVRNTVSAR